MTIDKIDYLVNIYEDSAEKYAAEIEYFCIGLTEELKKVSVKEISEADSFNSFVCLFVETKEYYLFDDRKGLGFQAYKKADWSFEDAFRNLIEQNNKNK